MEIVAHRAGNSVAELRAALEHPRTAAQRLIIEVDIHLGRLTRVEVRHSKRLWPSWRLWDRWFVLPRETDPPELAEILAVADDATEFWLDLKGFTRRLSSRVLREVGDRRPLVVSSKAWWLLAPFAELDDVRTFRSVGNRFELALLHLPSRSKIDGVVIHRRLVDDRVAARLLCRGHLFTWAVRDRISFQRMDDLGVTGVILDDLTVGES